MAETLKIPRESTTEDFRDIISKLLAHPKARAVVLFVNEDNCHKLIRETVRMGLENVFHWLASDSWGAKAVPVSQQEFAAEGAVTILPQREVLKGFLSHNSHICNKEILFKKC